MTRTPSRRRNTSQDKTYKLLSGFLGKTAAALAVLALPSWAATITITVPGIADVWLAGQPNGATLGNDIAPTNSPVLASSSLTLTAGGVLSFSATGTTNTGGGQTATSPDGTGSAGTIPANSLSGYGGPGEALIGVFIGSGLPSGSSPATLDFSTAAAQSAGIISPLLQQVFFIGDGLTGTGSGSSQQFTTPAGATRLFLGTADTVGNSFNNTGSFNVTVSDNVPVSGTPEPGTALLLVTPAVVLFALRRRLQANR